MWSGTSAYFGLLDILPCIISVRTLEKYFLKFDQLCLMTNPC